MNPQPESPLLESKIRTVVVSRDAAWAAMLWGLDSLEIWPMDEMQHSGREKVARWLKHRFA